MTSLDAITIPSDGNGGHLTDAGSGSGSGSGSESVQVSKAEMLKQSIVSLMKPEIPSSSFVELNGDESQASGASTKIPSAFAGEAAQFRDHRASTVFLKAGTEGLLARGTSKGLGIRNTSLSMKLNASSSGVGATNGATCDDDKGEQRASSAEYVRLTSPSRSLHTQKSREERSVHDRADMDRGDTDAIDGMIGVRRHEQHSRSAFQGQSARSGRSFVRRLGVALQSLAATSDNVQKSGKDCSKEGRPGPLGDRYTRAIPAGDISSKKYQSHAVLGKGGVTETATDVEKKIGSSAQEAADKISRGRSEINKDIHDGVWNAERSCRNRDTSPESIPGAEAAAGQGTDPRHDRARQSEPYMSGKAERKLGLWEAKALLSRTQQALAQAELECACEKARADDARTQLEDARVRLAVMQRSTKLKK